MDKHSTTGNPAFDRQSLKWSAGGWKTADGKLDRSSPMTLRKLCDRL